MDLVFPVFPAVSLGLWRCKECWRLSLGVQNGLEFLFLRQKCPGFYQQSLFHDHVLDTVFGSSSCHRVHVLIGRHLCSRQIPGEPTAHQRHQNELSKRKVLRMIIIVVVTFALCWLPTHIQHLLIFYFNNTYKALLKVERLNSFLFFPAPHANSAVNPCLLISLNQRFTNEFKGILRCLFCRNPVLTRRSIGTEPPVVLTRIRKTVRQCSNSVIPLRTQQRPRSQSCSFWIFNFLQWVRQQDKNLSKPLRLIS